MHPKITYPLILILFCCLEILSAQQSNEIIEILFNNHIIGRDSGKEVTKEFLSECLTSENPSRYKIKNADIIFTHYISCFEDSNNSSIIVLITEDGASVENRWIFKIQNGEYSDIKDDVWPEITPLTVSQLLTKLTGKTKYTENYIRSVCHSKYCVTHTPNEYLIVTSGIPDESFGTELGIIKWDGHKFKFLPKSR